MEATIFRQAPKSVYDVKTYDVNIIYDTTSQHSENLNKTGEDLKKIEEEEEEEKEEVKEEEGESLFEKKMTQIEDQLFVSSRKKIHYKEINNFRKELKIEDPIKKGYMTDDEYKNSYTLLDAFLDKHKNKLPLVVHNLKIYTMRVKPLIKELNDVYKKDMEAKKIGEFLENSSIDIDDDEKSTYSDFIADEQIEGDKEWIEPKMGESKADFIKRVAKYLISGMLVFFIISGVIVGIIAIANPSRKGEIKKYQV